MLASARAHQPDFWGTYDRWLTIARLMDAIAPSDKAPKTLPPARCNGVCEVCRAYEECDALLEGGLVVKRDYAKSDAWQRALYELDDSALPKCSFPCDELGSPDCARCGRDASQRYLNGLKVAHIER